ncbi:Putative nuclease [Frankliniella fusca]|uniref:Nuclease n=1 Tax=Frankliniella fusca TaxID=407009 RepID=A0AAE1L5T4_9NEOP|nr:Putative nuclease [Frankliniella fusca]
MDCVELAPLSKESRRMWICDATLTIQNVCAAFPGSSNDFFVWNGTAAKDVVVQAYFEDRCDSGYFLAPWLHVPIPHAAPGSPEFDYTDLHCSACNCVERCIGVLKARWRCLCSERALTYRPTFAGKIINACCVLHNYCPHRGLPNPRPYLEPVLIEPPDFNDLPLGLHALAAAEQQYLINYAHSRKQVVFAELAKRAKLYGKLLRSVSCHRGILAEDKAYTRLATAIAKGLATALATD